MKKSALLPAVLVVASFSLVSCGGSSAPPLTTRVLASQSVSSPTAAPGLVLIDGQNDTLVRGGIGAGSSPGLMTLTPDRTILLAFDSVTNSVEVVNAARGALAGSIPLAGPTTSMVALASGSGYAAVPAAPMIGSAPGAIEVLNLSAGGITATIGIPSAQTVVSSPDGTHLLVFSNDSNAVTVVYPLLVNTDNPVTATVPGFDRPVNAVFSADGSTAYILNCGPECGSSSASASVQTLDIATLTVGAPVPVDGATIGWLSGSTLYVAGTPTASVSNPAPNNSCPPTTAAKVCGRLDLVDLGSMTVTSSAAITDGYHGASI